MVEPPTTEQPCEYRGFNRYFAYGLKGYSCRVCHKKTRLHDVVYIEPYHVAHATSETVICADCMPKYIW